MYTRNLKEELEDGRTLFGLCCMYPASGIIEGMCCGWDMVWIDGQHGEHTNQSLYHCTQASRSVGIHSILRVPGHEASVLSQCADMAPSALMIPMVNSAKEAIDIVKLLKFAPKGIRSYGGRAPIDLYGREYYCTTEPLIIAQIETQAALEQADRIAAVEGVDAIFFGPDDMKLSMGIDIGTSISKNIELAEGVRIVAASAQKYGKYCGIVAAGAPERKMCLEMGYQIIIVGGDSAFIRTLSAQKLSDLETERLLGASVKKSKNENVY